VTIFSAQKYDLSFAKNPRALHVTSQYSHSCACGGAAMVPTGTPHSEQYLSRTRSFCPQFWHVLAIFFLRWIRLSLHASGLFSTVAGG
jgi:hypothetical protein